MCCVSGKLEETGRRQGEGEGFVNIMRGGRGGQVQTLGRRDRQKNRQKSEKHSEAYSEAGRHEKAVTKLLQNR